MDEKKERQKRMNNELLEMNYHENKEYDKYKYPRFKLSNDKETYRNEFHDKESEKNLNISSLVSTSQAKDAQKTIQVLNDDENIFNPPRTGEKIFYELNPGLKIITSVGASFSEYMTRGSTYIDKTNFIKDIIDGNYQYRILITRPRRWGKSLNLSMIGHFFKYEQDEEKRKKKFRTL